MNRRKLVCAAIALLLSIAMTGCSLVSVNEEKDMAQVVAKVGDIEVQKSEYTDLFNYYLGMYQMYGYDPTATAEELTEFQDMVLEDVISGYVMDYKAKEQGMDVLTAEEQAELDQSMADELGYVDEMVAAQLESELAADPALDRTAREAEIFAEFVLSYAGEEMDRAGFESWLRDQLKTNIVRAKLQESFNASVTVTDGEVQAYFDELVTSDTEYYENSPSFFRADQEYYEMFGGNPIGYAPEGYIRVKHILFAPEEALGEDYTTLEAEMTALSEELGRLTVEDEAGNADRIAEIKEEYAAKRAEANALKDAHFDGSRAEAQAAWEKLRSGADFDALMAEHNGDLDFEQYPILSEKGKLMSAHDGDDTDWSDEVKQATLALSAPGEYTAVVEDGEGCHILLYLADEPAGPRSLGDYEAEVRETVLGDKQYEEWNVLLEEWLRDTSLITRYPDRIRDVGAAVG